MRLIAGLSEITGKVVIPAHVQRVTDAPLIGLVVRSDVSELPLVAHRVLLLVQGAMDISMEPLDEECQKILEQTFLTRLIAKVYFLRIVSNIYR